MLLNLEKKTVVKCNVVVPLKVGQMVQNILGSFSHEIKKVRNYYASHPYVTGPGLNFGVYTV